MPKPDNTERNARIIELSKQGKQPTDIARALRIGRGIVSGVLHRARRAGKVALTTPPQSAGEERPSLPRSDAS
jgi:hypothetical protein